MHLWIICNDSLRKWVRVWLIHSNNPVLKSVWFSRWFEWITKKNYESSDLFTNSTVNPRITLNTMPVLIHLFKFDSVFSVFSDNWEIGADPWCGFCFLSLFGCLGKLLCVCVTGVQQTDCNCFSLHSLFFYSSSFHLSSIYPSPVYS